MSKLPATRTFGELRRAVQRGFGDESGVQLEDQDVIDFANDGLTEIVTENAVIKARSTSSTVSGQGEYTFPDVQIARVEYIHLAGRILQSVSFPDAQERLGQIDPDLTQTGAPQFWYSYGETFWLWPTPTDVAALEIFFVAYPERLTGAQDQIIGLPDKWFNPLVDFVLKKAYEMDQDWQAAQVKEGQFKAALMSQAEEESQSQFGSFPVIREV
jgi:hypothetical protein